MSELGRREIAPAIRERIERNLRSKARPAGIPRRERSGPVEASFAQQRLWFLDQLEPASPAYVVPYAAHVRGDLDCGALERALAEIVSRHEVLRTAVVSEDGSPVQIVAPGIEFVVEKSDVSSMPEEERWIELRRILEADARLPFDLSRPPLLRARIVKLGPAEHVLGLALHHVVSDAWSFGVLFRELEALYGAFVAGRPSPLPELPIQYADFSVWQRESLAGEAFEEQVGFWKQRLAGAPPTLDLPADRLRPTRPVEGGAHYEFQISPALTDALRTLSGSVRATLYMTLVAAFDVLLFRYTGEEDLVIGTPVANRPRRELEPLIGFFVNSLPLRANLSGDPTFRELLSRARTDVLEAISHEDVPFERLVEELRPARDPGRNPIFQVMLILQNTPREPLKLPGLEVEHLPVESGSTIFDLTLSLTETPSGLQASFEYNRDLFDAARIERMAEHFQRILEAAAAAPETRISRLPLLSPAERRRIVEDWNATDAPYPNASLAELFEQRVRHVPDRPALLAPGSRPVTFADLNARANRLANHLRARGVEAEDLVGVCLERSIDAVAALLAIAKTGAAWMPLDPAYPPGRLALVLEDTRPRIVVSRETDAGNLPRETERDVVLLDREADAIGRHDSANLETPGRPDRVAYVLHTSGSTGQPKGVRGLQRGIVNRLAWSWNAFPFRVDEVCCQKTSLAFVDSVAEIFGPLLAGIPSVVVTEDVAKDPAALVRALRDHSVTRIVLVPTFLRALLDEYPDLGARLPALTLWVSSGEALTLDLGERFRKAVPDGKLVNLYGASETSADSTCAVIFPDAKGDVSIGRPIANTRVYVLDRGGEPAPIGVPGEIYVGGTGVAAGYRNRPELTAETFLPDPFRAGERLYRTGDIGRFRPDGRIDYLGRRDAQVKIRGHRIEPAEVEAALAAHPSIREYAVTVRPAPDGDPQLVAYFVPHPPGSITTRDLTNHLRRLLPEAMIPGALVALQALPRLPNGKVDRFGLPPPENASPPPAAEPMSPRTLSEEILWEIFTEVLARPSVGIRDDFFMDLGGHSLKATRVIARAREAFGIPIKLALLFENPTIERLAEAIEEILARQLESSPNG